MGRTKNNEFDPCPICGKRPYVDIYDVSAGEVYCYGGIIKKHNPVEICYIGKPASALYENIKNKWNREVRNI